MNLLALDPATKCGWAVSPEISGTWDLSVRRDESDGMRLIRLKAKLNEIKDSFGVDVIVYESARNLRHGNAVRVAGEIQGQIKTWAIENGVEIKGYSPKEVKKFATGKGNASKDDMLEAARRRHPDVNFVDDNHADAVLLWSMAYSDLGIAKQ